MARPKEWTLASCRTPRKTRKIVEDVFHSPNRVVKSKTKKNVKPHKKVEIKGSWDHTGDDSSQIAEEEEGNDSEDGSDDSTDKASVKGPALTSRGHLKGRKMKKSLKKTGSAGPIKSMQAFSRQKASVNRLRDPTPDETPTKIRNGTNLYTRRRRESTYSSALDSDLSDTSSFTMDIDLEIDDDETALNDFGLIISDSDESGVDDDDDSVSDELDEFDDEDEDDDDESILDEETEFIIGVPPTSDDGLLGVPSSHIPNSPSALSEDSDDELEDIYMDMDDPVVQKIMNHSYTICDDTNENSDDMLEPYFSDEASEDSDEYDSDATVYDESAPKPTPAAPGTLKRGDRPPSAATTPTKSYAPPKTGLFKADPNRLLCLVENIRGASRVLVMTVDEYYGKAESSSTSATTPGPKASEELFAYLPSRSQYSGSIPTEDQMSLSSFNRNWGLGSDWDESSIVDASFYQDWADLIENLDGESTIGTIETDSLIGNTTESRRGSEQSAIPAFAVPVTAFRANQNNALSRSNSIISAIHSSGIKRNAPRKDSSLTPSQRRKSDATQPRHKTPTPPVPFPVPLEPLFADHHISVNPAAV
ncbi:hypothetical protein ABW19_dt0206144 [Dactylella cylindrospora]|nr:hypothetical protein ABW19_dt0206144 [Dactylella cylindrospora]